MRSQHGSKNYRSENECGIATGVSSKPAEWLSHIILRISGWLGRPRSWKAGGGRILPGSFQSGEKEEAVAIGKAWDGCCGRSDGVDSSVTGVLPAGDRGEANVQGPGILPPATRRPVWRPVRVSEVSFDVRFDGCSDPQRIREKIYRRQSHSGGKHARHEGNLQNHQRSARHLDREIHAAHQPG